MITTAPTIQTMLFMVTSISPRKRDMTVKVQASRERGSELVNGARPNSGHAVSAAAPIASTKKEKPAKLLSLAG